MNRRAAVTLTEVLVAIFVMGLGLMGILSLFPLGAAQMAQALKDQRAAECGGNAASLFRLAWKEACELGGQGQPDPRQRFVTALTRPNDADAITPDPLGAPVPQLNMPPTTSSVSSTSSVFAPSYPVYVDSIGWQSNQLTPQQWWVAGGAGALPANVLSTIPRRPLYLRHQRVITTPPGAVIDEFRRIGAPDFGGTQRVLRFFSLLDDMTFKPDGSAQTPVGGRRVVERQGRYSWAYMVQRPNRLVARQVNLTVVVYSGRSIDVASPETGYLVGGIPANGGGTEIALNYTGRTKPAIRRGWWVLDATMGWNKTNPNNLPDTSNLVLAPQGAFYRVVNVNDDTPNVLLLELQTPVRGFVPAPPVAGATPPRAFVVMENVVEVFEKGMIDPKEEIRPY